MSIASASDRTRSTPTRTIGITVGDPAGIGPEIICSALSRIPDRERRELLVIGTHEALVRADVLLGSKLFSDSCGLPVVDTGLPAGMPDEGVASAAGGAAAYAAIERAVEFARTDRIAAIVTAPLSKEALHHAGYPFDGHTGLLAHLCSIAEPYMLLATPTFATVHVSAHVSLSEAIARVTRERVLAAIIAGHGHLRTMGCRNPRVRVAGLNPHAGEQGIFGTEDKEQIAPAVRDAAERGMDVTGPHPPDTVFRQGLSGDADLIVAQYHDQGHIPTKLVAFDKAVNVTLGLPLHRVSVDHGTAFDIAWKGRARADNLLSAISYARKLVEQADRASIML